MAQTAPNERISESANQQIGELAFVLRVRKGDECYTVVRDRTVNASLDLGNVLFTERPQLTLPKTSMPWRNPSTLSRSGGFSRGLWGEGARGNPSGRR